MRLRHIAALSLAVLALGACKKKAPPAEAPAPAVDSAAIRAREQARRDSIAAAERARREAEERARAAAVARARETLTEVVYFEYDSEQLTSETENRLRTKAAILRSNPSLELRIEGHADERGSTEYNLALGQRRAESVRNFLAGYGIDAGRLATISFGEERPAVDGGSDYAWSQNRRAEFVVTSGSIATIPAEVR